MHNYHTYPRALDYLTPEGTLIHNEIKVTKPTGIVVDMFWEYSNCPIPITSKIIKMHRTRILTADNHWDLSEKLIPKVIIPVGIPTSGKSTWVETNFEYKFKILSRDVLRLKLFGKNYKQNKPAEAQVTELYNNMLDLYILNSKDIVLDNTHCNEATLKATIKKFSETNYEIHVVFFDIPLWKAYLRNIIRNWRTGKWIPIKVIKNMKRSYDKINKNDYAKYKL